MQEQFDNVDVVDGQFYFNSTNIPPSGIKKIQDTPQQIKEISNISQNNIVFGLSMGETTNITVNQLLSSHFEESNIQESKNIKKRNSQNSIRTITRVLKNKLSERWNILIPNFYLSPKQLDLLAIFRKQCQCGKLQQIQTFLQNSFKDILVTQHKTQGKQLKLQKYLNFLLKLTKQDLLQDNLEATIKQMSTVAQFKRHPINSNIEQLKNIEAQIQLINAL